MHSSLTHSAKNLLAKLFLSFAVITSTVACVPAVVGGAAAGTSAAIDRRTTGIFVEDENIEIKAIRKMETNLGEESHVNVTSFNQNVLLTGEVPDAERKAKAESLMKEVEQVRSVTNEIVVSPKTDLSTRANDTYLTSKVKTSFLTENKFQANYVKVVTENSVVYLMGLVTKEEADAAAAIASNTSGVEKVVKVFEYIN